MKVMLNSTIYVGDEIINKYPCLKGYNVGYCNAEREVFAGYSKDENGKTIKNYKCKEVPRIYVQIDTLYSLHKLVKELRRIVHVCIDSDFEDRLCIKIDDGYRGTY